MLSNDLSAVNTFIAVLVQHNSRLCIDYQSGNVVGYRNDDRDKLLALVVRADNISFTITANVLKCKITESVC
jgi:hypothetical protein